MKIQVLCWYLSLLLMLRTIPHGLDQSSLLLLLRARLVSLMEPFLFQIHVLLSSMLGFIATQLYFHAYSVHWARIYILVLCTAKRLGKFGLTSSIVLIKEMQIVLIKEMQQERMNCKKKFHIFLRISMTDYFTNFKVLWHELANQDYLLTLMSIFLNQVLP